MQLLVAEKPSVARTICSALGIHGKERKEGYIEGDGRIVSWCLGHLVELAQPAHYDERYKKWSYGTLPIIPETWEYEVRQGAEKQFRILKGLMDDERVTELVECTDCGREGELIFRLVYEKAGCRKPFKRLWTSSLEESAIREGFERLRPGSDFDALYKSALCRQRADWLVGMNGTRLFTSLYGGRAVLKVGRVQSPTLAMIVRRSEEIKGFEKKPFYTVHLDFKGMDAVSERYSGREEAEAAARRCMGQTARVRAVETEKKYVSAPKLYDLTALQRDANRFFGFTAKQTHDYAQSLYEKKLCTYPRTDSRYLSDDMGETARGVLAAVLNRFEFAKESMGAEPDIKSVLNSGRVTDHHAIIPTMEIAGQDLGALPEGDRKILSLVALRLVCSISDRQVYESVRADIECGKSEGQDGPDGGISFSLCSKTVISEGWKRFEREFGEYMHGAFGKAYGQRVDGAPNGSSATDGEDTEDDAGFSSLAIGSLTEGETQEDSRAEVRDGFTTPPAPYTEDSLLSAMENAVGRTKSQSCGNGAEKSDHYAHDGGSAGDELGETGRSGIGTPATRADIIEGLVRDGYIKREKKRILPTEDGARLISILPERLKSAALTAEWENDLRDVAKGDKSETAFMHDVKKMVDEMVAENSSPDERLLALFRPAVESLGSCPKCGGDVVRGKFGPYCAAKCGMSLGYAMGKKLDEKQVIKLLKGDRVLLRGLIGKNGSPYDAYVLPIGVDEYSYTKDGTEQIGTRYKLRMEPVAKKKE